jgi:MurNAc alpha-1-phosphate uridylyltransferase
MIEPALLRDAPSGKWSLNVLFDRAIAAGRLFGVALEGEWLHVGTPEAIPLADARFAASNAS